MNEQQVLWLFKTSFLDRQISQIFQSQDLVTQEDVQTFTRVVELVDSQSSLAPPIEIINKNKYRIL